VPDVAGGHAARPDDNYDRLVAKIEALEQQVAALRGTAVVARP
jgi:hypothetical protein